MPEATACLIIAEAGVNHNGSIEMALELIDVAADAGADVVKFQTFSTERLVTGAAPKAEYQVTNTGNDSSQHEMLRKLELDHAAHERLLALCADRGIEFLSTPFDEGSLAFLDAELGVSRIKLGSGELTNAPLLLAAGRTGKPVILSTGMGTLADIEAALGPLAFGYTTPDAEPSETTFRLAAASADGKVALMRNVILLHCTTAYPTPVEDANIRAMTAIHERFGIPVGYSDHTEGIAVALAAVACGACVIEKHITLDRTLPGPDHRASIEPDELNALVSSIRVVEASLGTAEKGPRASEFANIAVARKSLVAIEPIRSGETFTRDNLGVKRPGSGLSPFRFWEKLGRIADRDYDVDDIIQ